MGIKHRLSPYHFVSELRGTLPGAVWLAGALWILGIGAVALSPEDIVQGGLVRFLYLHVPVSWSALILTVTLACGGGVFWVGRLPLGDWIVQALTPLAFFMALLSLLSGMVWGTAAWGTFWVWDARLMLTALLTLILGFSWGMRLLGGRFAPRGCAFLSLVSGGVVALVKGAVLWWPTLHQPASLLKISGPSLHPSFLIPLALIMAALSVTLFIGGVRRLNHVATASQRQGHARRLILKGTTPSPQGPR